MAEPRIALCFSGQIRTGVEVAVNILNYLGELRSNCDVFVHTWDVATTSPVCNSDNSLADHFKVDKNVFSNFHSVYNPISMVVEPYDLVETSNTFGGGRIFPQYSNKISSMFESIYEANKLKKNHEEKYGFKYDYAIRIRPDIVFHPRKSLKQDLAELDGALERHGENFFSVGNHHGHPTESSHLEDIFWISSSEIMDKLAEFVYVRAEHPAGVDVGEAGHVDWQQHMKSWVNNTLGIAYKFMDDSAMRIYYQSNLKENMEIVNPEFGPPPHYGRFTGNQKQ